MVNVKQEFMLLLSASDLNAIYIDDAANVKLNIISIHWRIPYETVSDKFRIF